MHVRRRRALLFPLALALVGLAVVTNGAAPVPPAQALVSPTVPAVDTADRAAVNALYQAYYNQDTPAIGWTGSIAGCNAGSVSTDYQLAVLRRINYFRSLAGIRSDTVLATGNVTVAQAAALMMSASNKLSHAPDPSFTCYTADGNTGAQSSNLALGVTGPGAIDAYMEDAGAGNTTVGHRWWLLQPNAASFASGNVPATGSNAASNAVHVTGIPTSNPWPVIRDPAGLVFWPARGYVPAPNVPDRWSVFGQSSSDFTAATVTATVDGVARAVIVDSRGSGLLVFHFSPALTESDADVRVVIGGATVNGVPLPIDYTSRTFTPGTVGGGTPPPTPPPGGGLDYQPTVPERLLDTRPGGPQVGYTGAKPAGNQVVELQVTGAGTRGIPADAAAVALNLTVTEPVGPTFVTAWPCGEPRPTASNVNLGAGQTLPNLVVVRPGTGGRVCLSTLVSAHLVADVNGWFPAGTTYRPASPQRVLDTRPGGPQTGFAGAKPGVGRVVELQVTGVGAAAVAADASAVVLNVTVTEPDAATYVTVWPCGETQPLASNLNAVAGQTVANLVFARVGTGGKVCLFTQNPSHLVADLEGWFPAATGYLPTSPVRLLDTRLPSGGGRLAPRQPRALLVAAAGAQPAGRAVVLNVTAVDPAAAGFVTVWPCGSALPTASSLNVTPGFVAANLVVAPVDATGSVCFFSSVAVDLVVDRNGDF